MVQQKPVYIEQRLRALLRQARHRHRQKSIFLIGPDIQRSRTCQTHHIVRQMIFKDLQRLIMVLTLQKGIGTGYFDRIDEPADIAGDVNIHQDLKRWVGKLNLLPDFFRLILEQIAKQRVFLILAALGQGG